MGIKKSGCLMFFLCIGLLVANVAAMELNITGPSVITRGGVSIDPTFSDSYDYPTKNITDGVFHFSINNDDCPPIIPCSSGCFDTGIYLGLTINPQTMTGAYGDRPPFLIRNDDEEDIEFDRLFGEQYIKPTVDRDAKFVELVPNGGTYPSLGEWVVPYDGTHYYAYIDAPEKGACNLTMGTLYPSNFGVSGIKTGTYTLHAQLDKTDLQALNETEDYTFSIVYGDLAIGLYDYEDWIKGNLTPITNIIKGSKVHIEGKNTDSQNTYLWLTGKGLPQCGSGINPRTLPVVGSDPTLVNASTAPLLDGHYNPDGSWYINWDTSGLPLQNGDYTFFAASVNPPEVFPYLPPKGDCISTESGICAFESCPGCAPKPVSATISLVEPAPVNLAVTPSDVERCCCPGYPCGSSDSPVAITLTGNTGVSRQPLQIWLFGNNQIGDFGYLFDDSFITSLDKDGSFSIDLNKYFFAKNNLEICSLDPGTYYVVVQTPKVTDVGNEIFDVTLETSQFAQRVENAMFPHDQDSERYYVVKSDPLYWSKSFPVIGPDAISGYEAYTRLLETLEEAGVRDRYATVSFTIKDNACSGGSVDFSASPVEGYVPLDVQFNDTSTYKGTSWNWDFGDGTSISEQNPMHTFKSAGSFDVTLKVTNGTISKDLKKYDFIVGRSVQPVYFDPIADFTFTKVENEPMALQFIDQSSGSTPLTYLWNFGDNSTSTEKSPKHTFPAEDTYSVNLTVTDQFSKSNISSKLVTISVSPLNLPVADYTFAKVDNEPLTLQFIDQSYGLTKLAYAWQFGDSQSSIEKSPKHTFPSVGPYTVNLTVIDQYSQSNLTSKTITVPPVNPPTAVFNFTLSDVNPLQVQFNDQSEGEVSSWQWSFGDGLGSSTQSPTHMFSDFGTYLVTLTIGNSAGSQSVTNEVVIGNPDVEASFDWENLGDRTILFTDTSEGPIDSWTLEYGDGDVDTLDASGWVSNHKYTQNGIYPARLTVKNTFKTDSYSERITVT